MVSQLTELRREAARAEIVTAAQRMFYENGIRNTSLGQIAREVGLARPALYRYFPTKDDLIAATIQSVCARYDPATRAASSGSALREVQAMVDEVVSSARKYRADLRFLMRAVLEQLDDPAETQLVRQAINRFSDRLKELLDQAQVAGECAPSVDTRRAANKLTAQMLGVEVMSLMYPDFDVVAAASEISAHFIAAVQVAVGRQ